jgi:phage shock protein E
MPMIRTLIVCSAAALLMGCNSPSTPAAPNAAGAGQASGTQPGSPASPSAPATPSGEAKVKPEKAGGPIYIDVRTPAEWASGHLPGAIHLPLDRIDEVAQVVEDKSAEVVLYCASGGRSGRAAKRLGALGYTNASNGGGLSALAGRLGVKPVR